jgi:hypothetical protein
VSGIDLGAWMRRVGLLGLGLVGSACDDGASELGNNAQRVIKAQQIVAQEANEFVQGFRAILEATRAEGRARAELIVSFSENRDPTLARPMLDSVRLDIVKPLDSANGVVNATGTTVTKSAFQLFEPFQFDYRPQKLQVRLEPLRWYQVEFFASGATPDVESLSRWTADWLDVEEVRSRAPDSSALSGGIHSVSVPLESDGQWQFRVDFGSAEPHAFWELLDLLAKQGFRRVRVGEPADLGG